ncbi:MAG: RNA polymerase sigma factor [Clostridia bacterium]|nr:RNA polymerase sigma factor [Clostridia bacterium]
MDNGASSYRRFLQGDESGFVEIVRDYKDGLILYLNGFTNDIHIAEDLAEDTFVKLGIKKPKDKGGSSFKTWLYTMGRNLAVDYLRKQKKTVNIPLGSLGETSYEEDLLEISYLQKQQKISLHKAIKNLKPDYASVIYLTYFEGFSNKETAKIMKKSLHNIETLLFRARKSLKTQLNKEDFGYEEL